MDLVQCPTAASQGAAAAAATVHRRPKPILAFDANDLSALF